MKILIALHGIVPAKGKVVSGSGLRAFSLALGLRERGHTVHLATRKGDMEGDGEVDGFPLHIFRPGGGAKGISPVIKRVKPDLVILLQLEEAVNIEGDIPLVLDLYAPRLLESRFQGGLFDKEASSLFSALEKGDYFICASPRQKYFFLNLLSVAGVDIEKSPEILGVVPLAAILPAPKKGPRSKTPHFVFGGIPWPWQDPVRGIRACARVLDDLGRGILEIYSGDFPIESEATLFLDLRDALKGFKSVKFLPLLPYEELLKVYSRAWAGIHVLEWNYERELSTSFREMDYLASGLPIITSPFTGMAEYVERYGAGIIADPDEPGAVEKAVRAIIDGGGNEEMEKGALMLIEENFLPGKVVSGLLPFLESPVKRERGKTARSALIERASAFEKLEKVIKEREGEISSLMEGLEKKSSQIEELNRELRKSIDTINLLSLSLSKEIAFKKEGMVYLGIELDEKERTEADLREELTLLRRDIRKKTREIAALLREKEELKGIIEEKEGEKRGLEEIVEKERADLKRVRGEERKIRMDMRRLLRRIEDLKSDLVKKDSEIEGLNTLLREKGGLEKRVDSLLEAASSKDNEIAILKGEVEKKNREMEEVQGALAAKALAEEEKGHLLGLLKEREREIEFLRGDIEKKGREILLFEGQVIPPLKGEISTLESEAARLNSLLSERGAEVLALKKEREELASRNDNLLAELKVVKGDVEKKSGEIEELLLEVARIKGFEGEVANLKEVISKLRKEIRALKADIRKKSGEIENMAEVIDGQQEEIKHLEGLIKRRGG